MSLNHPESLELWQDWQRSRQRLRRAKHAAAGRIGALTDRVRGLRGSAPAPALTDIAYDASAERFTLWSHDGDRDERILIAVDSASPTSRASLLTFLPYLRAGVDVIAPATLELPELTGWRVQTSTDARALIDAARPGAVVSIGQHLALGRLVHEVAERAGVREFVVQHGALTPFAPPLPRGATLLAWTDADAAFWRSGRRDITTTAVGSQLLWQAAHETAPDAAEGRASALAAARPVFLGQMHGAELPRRITAGTAYRLCRRHDAIYRPHPAEVDVMSRAAHELMRRRGITVQLPDDPLRAIEAPVVAIFSTGVLEAAARGVPAWVHCPDAPGWVHEFWHRYDMRPYGGAPTPALAVGADEPAARIARILEESL